MSLPKPSPRWNSKLIPYHDFIVERLSDHSTRDIASELKTAHGILVSHSTIIKYLRARNISILDHRGVGPSTLTKTPPSWSPIDSNPLSKTAEKKAPNKSSSIAEARKRIQERLNAKKEKPQKIEQLTLLTRKEAEKYNQEIENG